MRRANRRNVEWETPAGGTAFLWEHVTLEVLMDIREELQKLNRLLYCRNFLNMPRDLRQMNRRLKDAGLKAR